MEPEKDPLVYSTRSTSSSTPEEPPAPPRQDLRVMRRRVAGGREVTEITGFVGPRSAREALLKKLRQTCATGGTIEANGTLRLQGNFVEKVMQLLQAEGHRVKRSGG
ncbi:MAG: translation initiation factor [Bacteroidia bacterium]|nr:translation initiation factor [Bacteroidia bacterium]MDW8235241.1 translation initiation factor [Bacteroidia bacterium]